MPIFEDDQKRQEIIQLLTVAYWMEIETVMNYISCSVNLDGVRAEEIKKSLAQDVTAEIGHAQQFARRIKNLSGITPGSFDFKAVAGEPAAARRDDRRGQRHQGRDRRRARRHRPLHEVDQGGRGHRLRDAGHGDPDPGATSRTTCASSRAS